MNKAELKSNAKRLQSAISEMFGVPVSTAQSLELIAKSQNFPSWDAACACTNRPGPKEDQSALLRTKANPVETMLLAAIQSRASTLHVTFAGDSCRELSLRYSDTGELASLPVRLAPALPEVRAWFGLKTGESTQTVHAEMAGAAMLCQAMTMQDGEGMVIRFLRLDQPIIPATTLFLDMPEMLTRIATMKSGLVVVTGSAGSGKSTLLASLAQHLVEQDQILTIGPKFEPPAQVTRRLIDTEAWQVGLKRQLARPPRIILFDEIRDGSLALEAVKLAKQGFLVIAGLHGSSEKRLVVLIDQANPDDTSLADIRSDGRFLSIHTERQPGRKRTLTVFDPAAGADSITTTSQNFSDAVRSVQRRSQEITPENLLIAEIRDPETAKLAVQAAQSGILLVTGKTAERGGLTHSDILKQTIVEQASNNSITLEDPVEMKLN
jgi:twitching motility protein PilT